MPNPGGSASRGVSPTLGETASGGSAQPGGFCPTPGGQHPGGSAQPEGSAQPWGVCLGVCPTTGGLPNPGESALGGMPRRVCLWGVGQTPSSPVNRMTHRCKNITLPQTSFAGGNKRKSPSGCNEHYFSILSRMG